MNIKVALGTIDCTKNTGNDQWCKDNIETLPTIFWHSQYKEGREKYEGGRDLKSITNFVLENTGHDHLVTK